MDRSASSSNQTFPVAGETASLVRSKDWSTTALGPMDTWPHRLRVLVETILAQPFPAVLLWGPELIQIYNDGYAIIAAGRHPTALGQPTHECWPEVAELSKPIYDRVLAGESFYFEDQPFLIGRAGLPTETFFTVSFSPVRDDGGNIAGILEIVFDTTAKVRAERARARTEAERLQLAEEQRLVLEAARLGWWHVDIPLGRASGDERLRAMTGITDDSVDVCNMTGHLHPDDRPRVQESIQSALDPVDPRPFAVDFRFLHPDGSTRWFAVRGLAAFTGEGAGRRAASLYGTAADVTEAKSVEATLRENAERLNLALAAAELGDWEWDLATDQITLSDRAAQLFGVGGARTFSRTWLRGRVREDYRERAREESDRASIEHSEYAVEYPLIHTNGKQIWVAAKGRGLYDASGKMTRMIGVVQDITESKRAQEEREHLLESERVARGEAERTNRMKDEFLATLSHELRTPLNAIIGWSQILRGGRASPKDLAEGLEIIERNARVQAQIIEDLLDMNRIISGKIRLHIGKLQLADVVEAGMETVRPAADAKGVKLVTDLDRSACQVMGDPHRLQQVIWNLLSNAVKFTPRGGQVHVTLKRVKSNVEVSVIDTGVGIKPEFLPYVFDRFRQADSSITRRHAGLGLGLAIVKQLIELHGGTVRVESAGEGTGASFTVALPVMLVDPENRSGVVPALTRPGTPSAHDRQGPVPLKGVKVLVVDDEPDARALVKRLLEDCQANVQTASSAAEAFERMRADQFDVLVSDIGMPGEDGYSLIRKVRALGKEGAGALPALALTAYARSEDRLNAIRAGFNMHVVKPVEPVELVTMVASLAGAIGRPQK